MKPMPRRAVPKRQGLMRRPVRTRMDASNELVKLEFERDSLSRRITEMKQRASLLESELQKVTQRAAWLHDYLRGENAGHSPSSPQTVAVTINVPVSTIKAARRRAAST